MKCLGLPDTMMTAVRSKNKRPCARTDAPAAWQRVLKDAPRRPNGAVMNRVATFQRQTYARFTSTRTQPEAAAPTAAPPTTARRVVRRATPATLTGVAGRPTLACAVSMDSESPSFFDHSTDPKVPHARTAATRNICLPLICFIEASLLVRQSMLITSRRLATIDLYQSCVVPLPQP